MKTLSWVRVLGSARAPVLAPLLSGLALVVAGAPANAMQWSGGGSAQQSGSSANTEPVLVGRGAGILGSPSALAQFEHPGQSIVRGQPTTNRGGGGRGGGFGFGHDPGHFHGHRHFIVVFVNGAPCWFPVYTYFPYGYDIPVDTSSGGVAYTADDGYVPAVDGGDDGSGPASAPATPRYGDLGTSWGQDLRREVATWGQFVGYLKTYVITAPAAAQADFRESFIGAYGLNGAAAYDKAAAEAAGIPSAAPSGPKVIDFPPPPPPSTGN
ncbi:MAG TPA: hypothetical protein VMV72_06700 [Verrucomicrobiae bacterium]|nr:hypothetical protein [Verrucomicrobiae bacterium]